MQVCNSILGEQVSSTFRVRKGNRGNSYFNSISAGYSAVQRELRSLKKSRARMWSRSEYSRFDTKVRAAYSKGILNPTALVHMDDSLRCLLLRVAELDAQIAALKASIPVMPTTTAKCNAVSNRAGNKKVATAKSALPSSHKAVPLPDLSISVLVLVRTLAWLWRREVLCRMYIISRLYLGFWLLILCLLLLRAGIHPNPGPVCLACGFSNCPDARFCNSCGTSLIVARCDFYCNQSKKSNTFVLS